jgi:hypothetical protein
VQWLSTLNEFLGWVTCELFCFSNEVDNDSSTFDVERIIAKRKVGEKTFYLVKWEGYDILYNSWEPESNFISRDIIDDFEERLRRKAGEFEKPRPISPLQEGDGRTREVKPTEHQCKTLLEKKGRDFAFKTKEKTPSKGVEEKEQRESQREPRQTESIAEEMLSKTENNAETYSNGFSRGLVPDAILGASKINGEPSFLIRWKGNYISEFVPTRIVYEYNPKMACYFYETKIIWVDWAGFFLPQSAISTC